ncbi:hypothetical protein ACFVIM_34515 [Streptomyces sp. NPDC057638]|uniref:hypothetical protein n=1 Tax=Streptomyces sp. NPDC057638 TaxID=3346190 RepID=UPI0036B85AD9
MYLVHAHLATGTGAELPREALGLVRASALRGRGVQHIACHPDGPAGPVLGVFVMAETVESAEARVATLCRRALRIVPALRGVRLIRCEVVLALPCRPELGEDPATMA